MNADQGTVLRDIAAQWVDRYWQSMGQPQDRAQADARLVALCAYEFEIAGPAEPDAKAMAIQALTRPPFQGEPALMATLVDFLMSREHRVEMAAVVLKRRSGRDDVTQFLREVRDEEEPHTRPGLDRMEASYERALNATVLLDGPDRRDDIQSKVDRCRSVATRIPSELVVESNEGPERFFPSWPTDRTPRTNCWNVRQAIDADLQAIVAAAPVDLPLDMPPSVMCFLERYHYALDTLAGRLGPETQNLRVESASTLKGLRDLLKYVFPRPVCAQFDRALSDLEKGDLVKARRILLALNSLVNDQKHETNERYSALLRTGFCMPPQPRTWSGVHEIECAIRPWQTDDNPAVRWNAFRWEAGAREFTRILGELAKKPPDRFSSLYSPVFETLSKLLGNDDLRGQVFEKAREAVAAGIPPVNAWIRMRQCVDADEIRNGSYDIQTSTSGFRLRVRKPLMEVVGEDFRNSQREICELSRAIPEKQEAAEKREAEIHDPHRVPEDFPLYAWLESTLLRTLVQRMYENDFSDDRIDRDLLEQGMPEPQVARSRAMRLIPPRRQGYGG